MSDESNHLFCNVYFNFTVIGEEVRGRRGRDSSPLVLKLKPQVVRVRKNLSK